MKDIILLAGIVLVASWLGFMIGRVTTDPLDVNRDGQANLVDLSVLAAQLNQRNQK